MSGVKNRKEVQIKDSIKFGLPFLFWFYFSPIESTASTYKLEWY